MRQSFYGERERITEAYNSMYVNKSNHSVNESTKKKACGRRICEGAFSRDVEVFDTNCDIVRTDLDVLSDIVKLSDTERGDWINDYIDRNSYAKIVDVEGIDGDVAKIVCLVNKYDDDGTCLVGLIVKNRDDVVGDNEWQYSENEYADLISRIYAIADDVLADIPGDGEQKPGKFDDYWTGRTKKERKARKTVGESAVPDFVKADLKKIDADTVRSFVEDLKNDAATCCSFRVGNTDKNGVFIVVGLTDDGEEDYSIGWQIGIQPLGNGFSMKTDMDFDFPMPSDDESGDVYDTYEVLGDAENLDYDALADRMNKTAEEVFAYQYEKDDDFVSSFDDEA